MGQLLVFLDDDDVFQLFLQKQKIDHTFIKPWTWSLAG
jgi:hypothetical protein